MRVLHVVSIFESGSGAARGVVELVTSLISSQQIDAHLCVIGDSQAAGLGAGLGDAVTFLEGSATSKNPAKLLPTIVGLARLIRAQRVDIIHSHLLPADLVSGYAAAITRCLHVAHVRDTRPWLASRKLRHRLWKQCYKLAYGWARTRFLAVSPEAASYAIDNLSLLPGRVQVVLDGIDPGRFETSIRSQSAADGGSLRIGSVGHLVHEKGFDVLVGAFSRAVQNGIKADLVLAGTGGMWNQLLSQARDEKVADHFRLLGYVDQIGGFYEGLDIFVLPSLTEGLPRVVMEAMSFGLPVIATQASNVGALVEDGSSGFMVATGDEQGLADAIERLCLDKDLRMQMGRRGRAIVEAGFTVERVASDVARFYTELVRATPTIRTVCTKAA